MAEWVEIGNAQLTAAINPHGAELSSLRDAAGRELMTDADPAYWTGRAPILFPVIGVVNGGVIRLDGVEHPMPKHGFARQSEFALVDHAADRATFRLESTETRRRSYPFDFRLDIGFALAGATLTVAAVLANLGDAAMPAQFGFHPAFAWPLPYGAPRADHRITFDRPEPGDLRRIQPDGLIDPAPRATPVEGDTLHLRDDLFTDDALVWAPVASQGVRYGTREAELHIAFPDTPALGIWTRPGARYVCVEPWHGIADPAGFTGDFRAKPGVFEVPAGGEKRIAMSVTLAAPAG